MPSLPTSPTFPPAAHRCEVRRVSRFRRSRAAKGYPSPRESVSPSRETECPPADGSLRLMHCEVRRGEMPGRIAVPVFDNIVVLRGTSSLRE